MKDAEQVLIRPVVSEKSYALMDDGVYVFVVDPRPPRSTSATPSSRPSASGSRTSTRSTARARPAATARPTPSGTRPDTKRAIVTLAGGDTIDLFEKS